MGIHIYNRTKLLTLGRINGECEYELFINSEFIARFTHKRSEGLADCLTRAAEAVRRVGEEDAKIHC